MIREKPLKCGCGKKPKLRNREIGYKTEYFLYECKCGIHTFATRKEEFARCLWNNQVERVLKII